ncbi:MAG: SLBB domain-containing protein [Planctomycetota bacterium]
MIWRCLISCAAILAFLTGCTSPDPTPVPLELPPSPSPATVEGVTPSPHPETPAAPPGEGQMTRGDLKELLQAPASPGPYCLRTDDQIHVTVYDHPDLEGRIRVPARGTVKFPLIGELEVRGRSLTQLEEEIRRRLEKEYVTLAPVSVRLEKSRQNTAYIGGRVARPGAYTFPPNQPMSLLQIVAKAGGFLEDADTERLRLIRGPAGARRFWDLAVQEIEGAGRIELDVPLADEDTIWIPARPKIHVLGCVQKPGALVVPAGTRVTLARILAQAGGFGPGADREQVLILRRTPKGATETIPVRFHPEEGKGIPGDVPLQAGDTVLVREAARVYVLGAVNRPGGFLLSEEILTATKAISLAGGFTRRADSNGTVVIRATASGQEVIRVRVRSIVSREDEKQVKLQPGDIVYVSERFF